ncbi:MAG: ATP-binding protein [Bacteroidota bacterium]
MNKKVIGRKKEQVILEEALQSDEAEMVSVIGRRRVGKTFLVTSTYKDQIVFEITGIQNAPLSLQLRNFRDVLAEFAMPNLPIEPPKDWLAAFQLLRTYLKTKLSEKKIVIFLDELPWLATHKSGFLQAFGYFWNSWASRQNLVVVICGSAASWMIKKVVHDKGGLHNRITKRITLLPFTLAETEEFLNSRSIRLDRYSILQLYMAMGGIPHYLKEIRRGKSTAQNIDDICFSATGLLKDEFSKLYTALFKKPERHISVIRALATKTKGMTRSELIEKSSLSSGSALTTTLEELVQSGFISTYFPFGKNKSGKLYRLTDEYSLFYLRFMEEKINETQDIWKHFSQTQAYKVWSGYAFESICLKHLPQIKKAMGISGIYSLASSFYQKGTTEISGIQIDLLLDRKDHVINLFELKFYNEIYSFTKSDSQTLRRKMSAFRAATKTKKQLFWTLVTTFGIQKNQYSLDIVDTELDMDILFEET